MNSLSNIIPTSSLQEEEACFASAFGNRASSEDPLRWVSLLQSFEDESLTAEQQLKKYQSLSLAASIISAESKGIIRQRFWSLRAVEHGEQAVAAYSKMDKLVSSEEIEETNTQLLLAMALNYFQDGGIALEEVADQFDNIDRSFLMRKGFCNNKLLRALDNEEIIQLPNHYSEISI